MVRYLGYQIIKVAPGRYLWRDPDTGYAGCTYSSARACKRVIDGVRRLLNSARGDAETRRQHRCGISHPPKAV